MNKPWFRQSKNTWYVNVGNAKVSLGVRGSENEADALSAWHRLMIEGKPKPKRDAEAQSVKELIDAFLADVEMRVKANTLTYYRRFLLPFAKRFGPMKANAITAKEAHSFAFKPTWGNSTRHDALTSLATAFRWGKVPLEGLRVPPKESRGAEAVIPEADYAKVFASAKGDFKMMLRFLWLTGCRPSEALALRSEMVDLPSGMAILKEHKTEKQTGKPRLVYLSPDALALVRTQIERHGNGFVFRSSNGNAYSLNNAVNILWRLNKKLGTSATLYGFRHSFATEGLAVGLPEAHVAELLGHSGTRMLHKHYAHLGAKARLMKEAAARVRA